MEKIENNSIENNIFELATKELSQDAVIHWCLEWGKNNYKSNPLHELAWNLIELINEKTCGKMIEHDVDEAIFIERQLYNIDILVVFKNQKKAILIEDKVDSNEREHQIEDYKKALYKDEKNYWKEKWGLGKKLKEENIITVFLKTGFFNDYNEITKKNVDCVVNMEDLLGVLRKYREEHKEDDHNHYILDCFIEHLGKKGKELKKKGEFNEKDEKGKWNVSEYHIAQYNLMNDLFPNRQSKWKKKKDYDDEYYLIRQEMNVGGSSPWTQLTILEEKRNQGKDDNYKIFWRIDRYIKDGPYIALRFYQNYDTTDDIKRNEYSKRYKFYIKKLREEIKEKNKINNEWVLDYRENKKESTLFLRYLIENFGEENEKMIDLKKLKTEVEKITEYFEEKGEELMDELMDELKK